VIYATVANGLRKPAQRPVSLAFYAFAESALGYVPFLVLIPGIAWPHNIVYSFVCSAIAGIWTFYVAEERFVIPKLLENGSVEALKLLHEADLKIMLQLSTIIVSAVGIYVLGAWFNVLWPSIPKELKATQASIWFQALTTLQVLHLIIGIWLGYFYPILLRLEKLRATISKKNTGYSSTFRGTYGN